MDCSQSSSGKTSESEGEDEPGKKFKIKIKPLAPDNGTVSTVDELKASVGTLAISTSPLCPLKRTISSEEIARPRRSTPTPTLTPGPGPDTPSKRFSDNASAFFGPPFEANFEAQNSEVFLAEPELWRPSTPSNTSPLDRRFPTGEHSCNSTQLQIQLSGIVSESEGEDEPGKKFKIKIKPLAPDNGTVSTVDELKASVGTLAISTSPLVRANKNSSGSQILPC
ncbi:hypothetical protein PDJAM_G00205130 [Pangasius djambal]|uniref:Uncharacterized protein n=1 Tax=Pangasius djambal TaxID=1691987 RepID=A0ACC5Y8G4_9TELE|nr:hypothetical protein [Pangasius djambal]